MSLAPNDPEVIIFERSPFENLDAIVQQDGRTVYFYLTGGEGYPPKACWLGNLVKGPMEINTDDMKQGIPPVMPRIHCKHPQGRELPKDSELEVVWFEEGNGAAILESGSVLGVIPPWSGADGFSGYARDCTADTDVAWPMPQVDSLNRRINNAKEFWHSFTNSNPFGDLQTHLRDAYQKRFGIEQQYWAIDNGKFPHRGMLQLERENKTTLATIGMSLFPQPNIEMYIENPSLYRRVELAIQIDTAKVNQVLIEEVGKFISSLTQMPWKNFTWFGHQHSCQFNAPSAYDSSFALLLADPREPVLTWRDDPVQTLWLVPIDEAEMNSIREQDNGFMNTDEFKMRLPF